MQLAAYTHILNYAWRQDTWKIERKPEEDVSSCCFGGGEEWVDDGEGFCEGTCEAIWEDSYIPGTKEHDEFTYKLKSVRFNFAHLSPEELHSDVD